MLMPKDNIPVHPTCMTCSSCKHPFGPDEEVFMKPNESEVFCIDCKSRQRRAGVAGTTEATACTKAKDPVALPASQATASSTPESQAVPCAMPTRPPPSYQPKESDSKPGPEPDDMGAVPSMPPPPPPPLWVSTVDAASEDIYFINTKTHEVTWDRPAGYTGIMVSADGRPLDPEVVGNMDSRGCKAARLVKGKGGHECV
jgi:hypothetical protein